MAKILIATPTHGGLHERCAVWRESIAHRYRDRLKFADLNDCGIIAQGRPVDFVRNSFIRIFLAGDFTHLFLLDSDTEPPLDCIERLLALDSPLAGGCYPVLMMQGLRWALLNEDSNRLYRLLEWLPSKDEPFEVDAGGAGCLLIRRDVFDKVKWPWFKWVEFGDGTQESEDIFFFRKCNEAGLRVRIDPSVICNHFKKLNITDLMRMKISVRKEA
jgi:GT2 family glycosyltransferase